MSGVEILASQEVVIEYAFNWVAFEIAFGIAMIIAIICGVLFACKYEEMSPWLSFSIWIIVGILMGIFDGILFGEAGRNPIKYETQYKVTISDEVKMSEFYEKYEIIEQDGKIYTVRERNE